MLTVRDLKQELKKCDDGALVIFQHEMAGVPMPVTRVEGENLVYNKNIDVVMPHRLTERLKRQGYLEDDMDDGTGVPCIVLWSEE